MSSRQSVWLPDDALAKPRVPPRLSTSVQCAVCNVQCAVCSVHANDSLGCSPAARQTPGTPFFIRACQTRQPGDSRELPHQPSPRTVQPSARHRTASTASWQTKERSTRVCSRVSSRVTCTPRNVPSSRTSRTPAGPLLRCCTSCRPLTSIGMASLVTLLFDFYFKRP